ncbi:distal tail protein Dit [Aquibacillus saliphilus]|uniref:distal tail protein Dit n=1 Tax=Aquibacillus saliphilus TaxID=1909422 RepID=UPI001CEFE917|nr:distal tail protein Dit [Aquibacillus saliphilus]
MTISESLDFSYAGVQSYTKGLYNVSTSGGLYEEEIAGNRSINEDEDIQGNRYLKDIDNQPLEFPVSFYFRDKFDREKIRDTTRWLLQNKYQPLIFNNYPDRIFYAIAVGSYRLIHNGLEQGYLQLNFRCKNHYAYSPTIQSESYNLSNNITSGTVIDFENKGDMDVQPVLHIQKVGAGDISFTNLSDEGKTMSLNNLVDGEEITIDCDSAELNTITGYNRYNDFNFNWLNLIYGINRINVKGNCIFSYTCQFKIY